ncbi:MAG: MarR family transcriptional regulator [Planctomycetota bacterium]
MPENDPAPRRPENLQQELGKKDPFELPEEEAYLSLLRTADRLADQFRLLFAEHGLTSAQYNALRIIGARGKAGIPSQSIAKDLVTRDPDITRLVARLVKAGLVERAASSEDRRVVRIVIRPEGTRLLRRLKAPVAALHREQLGHLGEPRLRQLSGLLFQARHPDEA